MTMLVFDEYHHQTMEGNQHGRKIKARPTENIVIAKEYVWHQMAPIQAIVFCAALRCNFYKLLVRLSLFQMVIDRE
jgi:hypothetical protein